MATRKNGRVPAAWIMAIAAGEGERSVTSQAEVTSRMKVPMLPSTMSAQITAKSRCRSGANVPVEGTRDLSGAVFCAVIIERSSAR
jgi:hypothetical protein